MRSELRAFAGLAALVGLAAVLSWLIYPLILAGGGPFADCLSDPLAWTPGASSLNCRTDPVGIHEMFDRAYRAGYLSRQTASAITAAIIGIVSALFLLGGVLAIVSRVSKRRRISENWRKRYDTELKADRTAERNETRRELRGERSEEREHTLTISSLDKRIDEHTGVDLTVNVVRKGADRRFSLAGEPRRVAEFLVVDNSGTAVLTLLDSQADFGGNLVGWSLHLHEAYVTYLEGSMRLLVSPWGRIDANPPFHEDRALEGKWEREILELGASPLFTATNEEINNWYGSVLAEMRKRRGYE